MHRLLGFVALAAAIPASVEGRWLRLEAGPFEVYSEGPEKPAREVLGRLELARQAFGGLAAGTRATPLPVRVFLLAENRFRLVRPAYIARGFYQSAAERDSIVLPAITNPRVTLHEYAHLVLHHTTGPVPQWLEEGLAEFYSTMVVKDGKVRLGTPVADHLRLLAASRWMTGGELLAITRESPQFNQLQHAGVFYAESWALVHMLRLGERYREGFGRFATALAAGESQASAFQRVFGKSASEAVADLKTYLDQTALPVVDLAVELPDGAGEARRVEITELDGDLAFAQLARDCGRAGEAEKIYAKLARTKPGTAAGEAALGFVALSQNRREEAKARFEAALAAGSRDAEVAFEQAMLVREGGAGREEYRRLLERVVEWNPMFAEAQFLLGVEESHAGRHEEAIRRIDRALAVFPRQSYFWHAKSVSLRALGKAEEAKDAARRALECAETATQVEMARAALSAAEQPAAAGGGGKRAPVETPASWQMKQGSERVEGVLEQIDCVGQSARFHVKTKERRLAVWVDKPGEVLLKNLSSVTFEFRCGPQKPAPIVIEYERRLDEARGTAGVVTAIEFR